MLYKFASHIIFRSLDNEFLQRFCCSIPGVIAGDFDRKCIVFAFNSSLACSVLNVHLVLKNLLKMCLLIPRLSF